MESYVKTRWTADGLVQIELDATTAHDLHKWLILPDRESGLGQLKASLNHTLAAKEKP